MTPNSVSIWLLFIASALILLSNFLVIANGDVAGESSGIKLDPYLVLSVEHAFGLGKFTSRGSLKLFVKEGSGKVPVVDASDNIITQENIAEMKDLLKANELYRIRIKPVNQSAQYIYASLPACELQKSGFKEEIVLHLDRYENLVGVSYSSPVATVARACSAEKLPANLRLQTKAKVADKVVGQAIPLQAAGPRPPYLQNTKLGTEEEASQGALQQQSFLRRYWYIILPIALSLLLGGGGDDKPAAGGGSGATGVPSSSGSS